MITSRTWAGKRYAVLGLARSGRATVEALLASGAEVVAWDSDPQRRPGGGRGPLQDEGNSAARGPGLRRDDIVWQDPLTLDLTGFTAVVVSPGVPLNRHPIAAHAAKYGVPIIGDIELFAQARAELLPHKVVGITGTNGKSTTTALVHHILETAGVPTTMGGNIGLPILGQEPLPAGGVYVLELSSFQIDLTFTLDCDVAVLLNITPDHLDRYDGFEAYAASKARLFEMQSTSSCAIIVNSDKVTQAIANRFTDRLFPVSIGKWSAAGISLTEGFDLLRDAAHGYYPTIIYVLGQNASRQDAWPSLQGPHNAQNAVVATAVIELLGKIGSTFVRLHKALRTYPGLPHRMERIREVDGVLYVNDSKATNATSTAPALAAYPVIHWILGGQAKTDELDACVPHLGHVKTAFTIGRDSSMLANILRDHGVAVSQSITLDQAVKRASIAAKPGETVLLSPACASFDQFKNFEDRGDQFRALVGAL